MILMLAYESILPKPTCDSAFPRSVPALPLPNLSIYNINTTAPPDILSPPLKNNIFTQTPGTQHQSLNSQRPGSVITHYSGISQSVVARSTILQLQEGA